MGDVAVGGCHGVDALDAADGDGVAVGAFVAMHAHSFYWDEDGEVLPGHLHLAFVDGVFDFCFDDVAGFSDDVCAFFGGGADDADGKARSGEGLAFGDWDVEGSGDFSDFVFVEVAEWFDEGEVHFFWESADVVVAFDGVAELSAGFDPVRGDGALD